MLLLYVMELYIDTNNGNHPFGANSIHKLPNQYLCVLLRTGERCHNMHGQPSVKSAKLPVKKDLPKNNIVCVDTVGDRCL